MYFCIRYFVFCLIVAGAVECSAETIQLKEVASGFDQPVHVTHAGDERLFVVEQKGIVKILTPGKKEHEVFLEISPRVKSGGEMGLLSIAFHPQFKSKNRFFVNYTTRTQGQLKTIVSEFSTGEDGFVNINNEKILLSIDQPYTNHNGGQLAFGPDGYLYIGMGDGGAAADPHGHGQNTNTLLGAILRVDVEGGNPYRIPGDNPFVSGGGRGEIWAYGLRNPWRFSFDRATGRLFAADVGQNKWEEVDIIERGKNYGWARKEGTHCFPSLKLFCSDEGIVDPISEYGRDEGISITGGFVYRGKKLPGLIGKYLFGDFGSSQVWAIEEKSDGKWERKNLLKSPQPISSFGEDIDGEIYIVGYGGTIFRLE